MSKTTITEIAEKCGCSISTVSKVFNNTGRVGKETAKRILEIADELGYEPSLSAQLLAGKKRRIAIIFPQHPTEVISLFEEGFRRAFDYYEEFGIEPVYYSYRVAQTEWDQLPFDEIAATCQGAVVHPWDQSSHLQEQMQKLADAMPVVLLQSKPNIDCQLCSVTVDAKMVGAMAAQMHHLSLGDHAKVAVMIGQNGSWIHGENMAGYTEFSRRYGTQILGVYNSDDDLEIAYQQTARILTEHPDVQGIFVTSYVSAAVCRCLAHHNRPLCVVGVDVFREQCECLENGRLYATFYQHQIQQAQKAVEVLVGLFRRQECEKEVFITPELVLLSNYHKFQS